MKRQAMMIAALSASLGVSACGTELSYRGAQFELKTVPTDLYSGNTGIRQIVQGNRTVTASAPVYGGIEPHPTWRKPGDPGYVGEGHWVAEE